MAPLLATAAGAEEAAGPAPRRQPRPAELATLVDYRDAQIARYAKSPDAAKALVSIGVTPADPKLDPARLAALTMTTAVVFNTPDAYWMRSAAWTGATAGRDGRGSSCRRS